MLPPQPFNPAELSRINSVISPSNSPSQGAEEDSSGAEFSEDEFDPIETEYENIPAVRPAPEGAEADSQYDVPELNESFEKEEDEVLDEKIETVMEDLDTSFGSSRVADMSSDSLMVPRY